jgi:hypothetical protein
MKSIGRRRQGVHQFQEWVEDGARGTPNVRLGEIRTTAPGPATVFCAEGDFELQARGGIGPRSAGRMPSW